MKSRELGSLVSLKCVTWDTGVVWMGLSMTRDVVCCSVREIQLGLVLKGRLVGLCLSTATCGSKKDGNGNTFTGRDL